jgi:zinc protease
MVENKKNAIQQFGFLVGCAFLFGALLLAIQPAYATQYFRLKNGLQVLVEPVPTAPVAVCSLWYKVGGSYEHNGYTGISHVLEHMMFQGTKKYPGDSFSQMVKAVGGEQNAFTSADYTVYFEKVPLSFLPKAIELEADRMQHLQINQKVFANEMQVVKEERRMRMVDNPRAVTLERFVASAHLNNPYHNPVIGWKSDLDAMTVSNIESWYETWYVPNNAILIVSGAVSASNVRDLAEKYFASIPAEKLPVVKPREEVKGVGVSVVNVNRPATLPWFIMGYTAPSLSRLKPSQRWQAYALLVLSGVLDAGKSSRLAKDLLRQKQFVSTVDVDYNPFRLYSGLFSISATPAAGVSVAKVKDALLAEINKIKTTTVTKSELKKVRAQVIAQEVYRKDSLMQQVLSLGRLVAIDLPWQEEAAFVKRVRAVTAKQVRAVARQYLQPDNLTIAILHPQKMRLTKKLG